MSYLKLPQDIKDYIRSRSLVIFIGAGISMYYGYPSWKDLIKRLVSRCVSLNKISEYEARELLDNNIDYLEIAGQCKRVLNYHYADVLKNSLEQNKKNEDDFKVYKNILSWKAAAFVTTNFDDSIIKADASRTYYIQDSINYSNLHRKEGGVYFVHGLLTAPNSIVLTDDEYRQMYDFHEIKNVWEFLFHHVFSTYNVIFIGYSINDPEIKRMLGILNYRIKQKNNPDESKSLIKHFALLPRLAEKLKIAAQPKLVSRDIKWLESVAMREQILKHNYNVEPIWYPKYGESFESLYELLAMWTDEIKMIA